MAFVAGTLRKSLLAVTLAAVTLAASGCDEELDAGVTRVKVKGETFYVELAADDETRIRGLGGREHIDDDGGMLFVFPEAERRHFVMRDCLIPIDIAFLDGSGHVLTTYTMPTEELRREDETPRQYEERLTRYSSRFPSQFVLELKAGTLERLGVEEGDQVRFDAEGLKKRVE